MNQPTTSIPSVSAETQTTVRPQPMVESTSPAPPHRTSLDVLALIVRGTLPILIFLAGVAVLIVAGKLKPIPKKEAKVIGAPRVETVVIEAFQDGLTLETDGSVVPFREIDLASEVSGRVKSKSKACRAGNYVEANTLLFEIDPVDYDLEVRRLSQELRQAEINLHASDIDIENTKSLIDLAQEDLQLQRQEVARVQSLVADRIASASELDRARRSEVAARNGVTQLDNQARVLVARRASQRAALDLVGTRLEKAEIDLKRTKVLSPIDGVIVNELVEEDAFIQRGATLVRVEDTSRAEVKCDLRADQLYWLWEHGSSEGPSSPLDPAAFANTAYELPDIPAEVIYRVGDREFAWQGRLDRFDGSGLNPRTRTVPCRVVVADPRTSQSLGTMPASSPPALVRGMFVTVRLAVQPRAELAAIPIAALQPGNRIWMVRDHRLLIRDVRVARLGPNQALLELAGAPFAIGDTVVVTPLPAPTEGLEVSDTALIKRK